MTIGEIVTIGAYNYTADQFFQALEEAGVDTFCDTRLRRAVRGSQYAFANSNRLQGRLEEMTIRYFHFPDLAPTRDMIQMQGQADQAEHIARRKRSHLSPEFISQYRQLRLSGFDSQAFLQQLEPARVIAIFCVEATPEACHRSLLSQRLHEDTGLPVRHLLPTEKGRPL